MHKASNHDWQKYMKRNVISVHTIDDNGIILFWVFPRSIYVSFKLIERANNFRKIKVAPAKKLYPSRAFLKFPSSLYDATLCYADVKLTEIC